MVATVIIFPIFVFILALVIGRGLKFTKHKAIGLAADVTTFMLLFSVPLAVRSLWEMSIWILMLVVLLVIAIILTYLDWRVKKEIEVRPLLKKIWRVYFLLLSITYLAIWIIGMTHSVLIFMMID